MPKILVIDDDKAITAALSLRLRSAGFDVEVHNNAHEASAAAARGDSSAIILDIDMPGFTGPEFHQCLKFSKRANQIPVVYLSGHDTTANRRMAAEQGAAAFITKPYDAGELVGTIREIAS